MDTAKQSKKSWSWNAAVARGREIYRRFASCATEMAKELYAAREALSRPGYRSDLHIDEAETSAHLSGGCGGPHTWEEYCAAVGIPVSTARRWLARYVPETGELLDAAEFRKRKSAELDALFCHVQNSRREVPDFKPDDKELMDRLRLNSGLRRWTPAVESFFRQWLAQCDCDSNNSGAKNPPVGTSTNEPASITELDQYGVFGVGFMTELTKACQKMMAGSHGAKWPILVVRYGYRIPAEVRADEILRLAILAEAILARVPVKTRGETIMALSQIILELGE